MTTKTGMEVLRDVLMRMRNSAQDGFHDVGRNGKFAGRAGFVRTSIPMVTPEELDALFEFAGIVPDPIIPKGSCTSCVHARPDGTERGYNHPCVSCKRPKMSNFDPIRPDHQRADHPRKSSGDCGCRVCVRPHALRVLGRVGKKNPAPST